MLGGPERINAEPAHSHLTVLVVRSGRSISIACCIDHRRGLWVRERDRFTIVGFGISGAPMLGTGASPTLFCVGVYVKTVTHTLELDPGARWSAGRVRVYGTHGPRSPGLTTSLRRTTGTRERCRWPARPPPDRRATMAGSGVLGPIPKAESAKRSPNAPLHPIPSPPKFNRTPARAGTANEITARFRFSKRKNTSLMR